MVSIFVKINGITGTGKGAHQGWLQAESFAVTRTRDSELIRLQDVASQPLYRLFRNATQIPSVTVDAVRNGITFWRAELSEVIISGVTMSAIPQPAETFSLNFAAIKTLVGTGLTATATPARRATADARAWSY